MNELNNKKTVCEKDKCAGCMACLDICPTKSIKIIDSLSALNAVINEKTCINCGLCHKVCQYNYPVDLHRPIKWFQGWGTDDVRRTSSSGGFAQTIIREFIKDAGIVASCRLQNEDFEFAIIESIDDIKNYIGSKYVKSNPGNIYKTIDDYLKNGQKVLFIGLPCQVAALKKYIPLKNQDLLYCIDLICHGTPSVKLLKKSLHEYGLELKDIEYISFRNNDYFRLEPKGERIVPHGILDRYTIAFLHALSYTENCYSCYYSQINRVGDLTIGDSWGTELVNEIQNGVSLILCQTRKGEDLIRITNFELKDVNLERAIDNNNQLQHPSLAPSQRLKFFNNINHGMGVNKAVARAFPKICFKQDLKELLSKMHLYRGGVNQTYEIIIYTTNRI